jgi:hypothetical protein
VPRYDIRCEAHGVHEVFRKFGEPFACEAAPPVNPYRPAKGRQRCFHEVEQIITSAGMPGVRIDCAGENSTSEQRIADGTAQFNMGLRGVDTVVGVRPDGKPKLEYRPLTHHEVGSNANAREIAKRTGLEMQGEGAYRTVVR